MAKDYAKQFYNSTKWRKVSRLCLISQHYLCQNCGGVACIVHHKQHITPTNINDPNITLNMENLKAVCLDCHNVEHGGSASVVGISFNDCGDLVYAPLKNKK